MTVLFVLASPEYLRFFDTTIGLLAERGHRVHLVVNEAAESKPVGLDGAAALPLDSVTVLPAPRTFWGDTAFAYRAMVDFVRFLHPDFEHAPLLRERIRRKVLPLALQPLGRIRGLREERLARILERLREGERALPVDPRVREFLARKRPSLVVVSPLVDAASPQVDWVKAAAQAGIPSALAVASWDNLTNKGLMRVCPDRVFLWNEVQQHEAVRYHAMPPDRIVRTGAPVFDRWFTQRPSRTREAFCEAAGLPDARPFVVFTGSSAFIADADAEIAFVRRWLGSLRASGDLAVRSLRVLVRPHPYNVGPWTSARLDDADAVVWPREPFNPVSEQGRRDFFDTLHFSAAVVGINTSAMIEAAIVGRPVLTVTEFGTQRGTLHFHYLTEEHGGPVRVASTLDEHAAQLGDTLAAPREARARAGRFVQQFVRPQGINEPSAPQLAAAIEQACRIRVLQRTAQPPGAIPRASMAVFGAYVATVTRLTKPDPFVPIRKTILDPLRTARRQAERGASRRRERFVRGTRLAVHRLKRVEHTMRGRIRGAPGLWKRCRRTVRQVRYSVGTFVRGGSAPRPGKS